MRFCLPVGEKLDGRVECFLFTPFNKKYRSVLNLNFWVCSILLLQVWNTLPQLQLCLLLQPRAWPGQPCPASQGRILSASPAVAPVFASFSACSALPYNPSGQDMPSFQEVKEIQKGEANAEYLHQTQICRIKTFGLEQVVLQHRFLFQDVNCIEKSGTNANSGAKDEAIVFTMRRGGKTYIFGQVGSLSLLGILIHFTHSNILLFSLKEGVDLFHGSTTLRYFVHTLFKRSLTGTLWLRSFANSSLVSLALEMTRLVSLLLARAQHSALGELTITRRRFNHESTFSGAV